MRGQKQLRDYGITVGRLPAGPRNAITDVAGVRVGHTTIHEGDVHTGCTAVIPAEGNLFEHKLYAACHVINGFGKTAGLMQIAEMGTLESPILLTNTLSVGAVSDALVEYMLDVDNRIGLSASTVNAVVCECNDGYLNDIRGRHVTRAHVLGALADAGEDFLQGDAGAGAGMSCYHLKGGIGTASRLVSAGADYTLGALLLTNFGTLADFMLCGAPLGQRISADMDNYAPETGSVIVLLATDAPLSERQLGRLARRASVGLARTGTYMGSGSGEVVITFTTANRHPMSDKADLRRVEQLDERHMDALFRAVRETVEESVYNSMVCAKTVIGRGGNTRRTLAGYMHLLPDLLPRTEP